MCVTANAWKFFEYLSQCDREMGLNYFILFWTGLWPPCRITATLGDCRRPWGVLLFCLRPSDQRVAAVWRQTKWKLKITVYLYLSDRYTVIQFLVCDYENKKILLWKKSEVSYCCSCFRVDLIGSDNNVSVSKRNLCHATLWIFKLPKVLKLCLIEREGRALRIQHFPLLLICHHYTSSLIDSTM